MKDNLLISHNRAGKEALQHHLLECDMLFQPRLSSRVAISEYVEKLFRSAERFELWVEDDLVPPLHLLVALRVAHRCPAICRDAELGAQPYEGGVGLLGGVVGVAEVPKHV